MRIDIIAVVPDLLSGPLSHSILQRAQDKNILQVAIHDLRDYGLGNYRQIDDYPYGGSSGMVLKPEPIFTCIENLTKDRNYADIIYMSPDGETLNQSMANQLSLKENIIILCGHYKGIDERVRKHLITREISIGDYVLSGGEIAAAVLVDAIGRLIPGVLNDETSALSDSFQDGLLAPPVYTRPSEYRGWKVPDVLLSGNFKHIADWEQEQAIKRTQEKRPDLLSDDELSDNE